MSKPVIGIMGDWGKPQDSMFDFPWVSTNRAYIQGLSDSGALTVVIPFFEPQVLDFCDAIFIQGGYDIDPSLYGEKRDELCQKSDLEMDRSMINAVRAARERCLPVFGVCRGLQLVNVAFGGTLWQDLSLCPGAHRHDVYDRPYEGVHGVSFASGSVLRDIIEEDDIMVNSLHHQAARNIAEGLHVCAVSDDGVVEGLENEDGSIIAVQWHPEALIRNDDRMRRLFDFIVRKTAMIAGGLGR